MARECTTSPLVWAASLALIALVALGIQQVDEVIALLWLGTLINLALSVAKMLLSRVASHPKALMADALHGLGDVVAEVVTALTYSEAARPPDREHPWGHGKIESLGAVLVTGILLYIAGCMAWESLADLLPRLRRCVSWLISAAFAEGKQTAMVGEPQVGKPAATEEATVTCLPAFGAAPPSRTRAASSPAELPADSARSRDGDKHLRETGACSVFEGRWVRQAAIAVTLSSVLLKESLFKATVVLGEREQSNLIVATAWHHRSDALAAGVALASQLGAALGHHYLDPLGGGVVAAMLAHSACGGLVESLNELVDYNIASDEDGDTNARCGRVPLSRSISLVQGVRNHTLRVRRMGPHCLVDATIVVDARISASAASMIAEAVHDRVVSDFWPLVTDVNVHVDPEGSPQSHRLDTHAEVLQGLSSQGPAQVGPEALEAQVREALLSLSVEHPELPEIVEVTELQSYYYTETAGDHDKSAAPAAPYVDIKVDIRLRDENVSIREAGAVARAARIRVLRALPHVVRDVDLDLELEERDEQAPTSANTESPATACTADTQPSHGSWERDPRSSSCLDRGPAPHLAARSEERGVLRHVTLIWERGSEAREARVPTFRHSELGTWTPAGGSAEGSPADGRMGALAAASLGRASQSGGAFGAAAAGPAAHIRPTVASEEPQGYSMRIRECSNSCLAAAAAAPTGYSTARDRRCRSSCLAADSPAVAPTEGRREESRRSLARFVSAFWADRGAVPASKNGTSRSTRQILPPNSSGG